MTGTRSLFQFRPRTVYVKVSTEILAELGEWSEPLHVRIDRDLNDDTFFMTFKQPASDDA